MASINVSGAASFEVKKKTFLSVGYLGSQKSAEEHMQEGSRLGQVYISVTNFLLQRGKLSENSPRVGARQHIKWRRLKALKGTRFPDLILGGSCGYVKKIGRNGT